MSCDQKAVTKLSGAEERPREASDAGARHLLERWIRAGTTPQRLVVRSRIVLLMLEGFKPAQIAARLGVAKGTVRLWTERYRRSGSSALLRDAPGRGRHSLVDVQTLKGRLEKANLLDKDGRPVSLRRAASVLGVSQTAVWRAFKRMDQTRPAR